MSSSSKNQGSIVLKKKTRFKTFSRSLALPGWGQIYASEEGNLRRKVVASGVMFGGFVALAGAFHYWENYQQSVNDYDLARKTYLEQTTMKGIDEWSVKAENANKAMKDNHNIAISVSLVGAAYWIGNAIEAAIKMPSY